MKLKVVLPSGVLVEQPVTKVVAEAENGSFCLLPRHVDFVAALVPGLLAWTGNDGREAYLALDEGVLVKHGPEVLVSTRNAVEGPLGSLRQAVREQFRELGEHEHRARTALDRLEASLLRQILEWQGRGHA